MGCFSGWSFAQGKVKAHFAGWVVIVTAVSVWFTSCIFRGACFERRLSRKKILCWILAKGKGDSFDRPRSGAACAPSLPWFIV
jgi:hypothetical protein